MPCLSRPTRWLAPVLLLALAGCFKLARTSPQLAQYVLGGSAVPTADTPTAPPGQLTVGLRRLQLASYLATPSIVVRRGPHQITTSEFHRWGEELGAGINRTLASQLARHPSILAVAVAPWPTRSRYDYVLQMHMQRFEGVTDSSTASGEVHVLASWDVVRPADDSVLMRGRAEIRDGRWEAGDYASLVRALDAALAEVARQVGASLDALRMVDSTSGARPVTPPR